MKKYTVISEQPFESWSGWGMPCYAPNHFYQTKEWFTVLTSTWTKLQIKIRTLDNQAALPVFCRKAGPLVMEGSPLRGYFTPYGGFLGQADPQLITRLLKGDFIEASNPPPIDPRLTQWNANMTVLVDLRLGADAIWKLMTDQNRKQTKKAMKNNVQVRMNEDDTWVEPAYEILIKTYSRQHLAPPAPKLFYQHMAAMLDRASSRVFTAYYNGTPVAYAIIGIHDKTVYGIDGGMDRAFQHVRPNNLVMWCIMQWALERGFTTFDMVGGDVPGIAHFKMGCGGAAVQYPSIVTTPTVLGKTAWRAYPILRPTIKYVQSLFPVRSQARERNLQS
jgi:hypothetical protein